MSAPRLLQYFGLAGTVVAASILLGPPQANAAGPKVMKRGSTTTSKTRPRPVKRKKKKAVATKQRVIRLRDAPLAKDDKSGPAIPYNNPGENAPVLTKKELGKLTGTLIVDGNWANLRPSKPSVPGRAKLTYTYPMYVHPREVWFDGSRT